MVNHKAKGISIDAHVIEDLNVEDVEAATSVHQDPSESSLLDDGVDHQRVSTRPGHVHQMVFVVKGDQRL